MGVEVVDERPYEIAPHGRATGGSTTSGCARLGSSSRRRHKERFQDAFAAAWHGPAESDGFNALVVTAGPDLAAGQGAARLRAVPAAGRVRVRPGLPGAVARGQPADCPPAGPSCSSHASTPRSPGTASRRRGSWPRRSPAALDEVASLDHDRILRSFLALIRATLRTNYFQAARRRPAQAVPGLQARPAAASRTCPLPRPRFEIWVYCPRVEGVHLRFGRVARGRAALERPARGLPHRGPRPGQGAGGQERRHRARGREGRLRPQALAGPRGRPRGVAGRGHRVLPHLHLRPARRHRQPASTARSVPPRRVVRHDDDDPYLVVAADKGTATFSDIANDVSPLLRLLAR